MGTLGLLLLTGSLSFSVVPNVLGQSQSMRGMQEDRELSAFVGERLASVGVIRAVPVFVHPKASGCAYASISSRGEAFIGADPECIGPLRSARGYEFRAVGILGHEIGHHLGGHVLTRGASHAEELEADFWSGWMQAQMGASLVEALTYVEMLPEVASKTHPARADRSEAVKRGWRQGSSGARMKLPQPSAAGWWQKLMQLPLPWTEWMN